MSRFNTANDTMQGSHAWQLSSNAIATTSTPLSTSSTKEVSPTSIVRPRAGSVVATWVSLPPHDDQDLLPRRKFSLGRYFNSNDNDDDDDEEFLLLPPQRIKQAGVLMTTQTAAAHALHVERQACHDEIADASEPTSSLPFRLKRRENHLANPFSSNHVPLPISSLSSAGALEHSSFLTTPPPAGTLSPFSPPPCRHEDSHPLSCMNIPDKLLLPSV